FVLALQSRSPIPPRVACQPNHSFCFLRSREEFRVCFRSGWKKVDGGPPMGAERERGFSLVELMLVCAVIVILSALSVPNIMQINANYKLDAAALSLLRLL